MERSIPRGPGMQPKSAIPVKTLANNASSLQAVKPTSLPPEQSLFKKSSGSPSTSHIPVPSNASKRQKDDHKTPSEVLSYTTKLDSPRNSSSRSKDVEVPITIHPTEPVRQAPAFVPAGSSSAAMNPEKSQSVEKSVQEKSLVMKSKIPVFSKPSSPSESLLARSSRDSDMKKNLLDMLSKSGDRRKLPTGIPFQQKSQAFLSSSQSVDHMVQPDVRYKPNVREAVPSAEKVKSERETEMNYTDSKPIGRDSQNVHRLSQSTHSEDDLDQSGKLDEAERVRSHQLSLLNTGTTTFQERGTKSAEALTVTSVTSTTGSLISPTKRLGQIAPSGTKKSSNTQVVTQSLHKAGEEAQVSSPAGYLKLSVSKQIPTTVASSIVTKSPVSKLLVSTGLSSQVASKMDPEESGKSSDSSLQSRESERNTVPLAEEFGAKEGVKAQTSEISAEHCDAAEHNTDDVAETSSSPDLSQQQDKPEKTLSVHKLPSSSKHLAPWYSNMKAEMEQLRSQLKGVSNDKVAQERQLRRSYNQVVELKRHTESLRKDLEREKGAVTALKRRIEDHNLETIQLKRQHTNEVSRLKTEMREKNEADRARLLNQIRELTQMTEEKNVKVNELEGSLSEAKHLASASSTTLEMTETKYTAEIKQLKTELQALTDLHKMSEEMYSSLSSNNADTEKKVKALIAENKTLTVSLKDQNEDNEILKTQLNETEGYITKLQTEKAEARAGLEKDAIERNVKLEVKYQEIIENLKEKLQDSETSREWLTEQLQQNITSQQPSKRSSPEKPFSRKVFEPKSHQQKTTSDFNAHFLEDTVSSTNKRSTRTRQYFQDKPNRKAYHQRFPTMPSATKPAQSRHFTQRQKGKTCPNKEISPDRNERHGEVLYILDELKKDGFDSTKATPEQTITYLWNRYNRAKKDREEANDALKEKVGDDQFLLLQELKMEVEVKGDQLRMAEQQLEITERSNKATHHLLKKKLEDLLQKSNEKEESAYAEQKKSLTASLMTENRSLKSKVVELRGEIMTKSASISQIEGDLAEFKRKNGSIERELSYEMRQKALLEAKVDNLQKQIKQQMAKFASFQEDSFNVTKDGSQHKAEVGKLKATIGKLESEMSLLRQELVHERDEKTAIQTQVDTFSSKLLQLQSQTLDGNTAIVNLKSKMEAMADECEQYKEELEDEKRRNDVLEKEAEALRKTLQDAQRKNASLEAELEAEMPTYDHKNEREKFLRLRAEYKCTHQELTDSTKSVVEIEKKMKISADDLKVNQELSKQLKEVVSVTKQELNGIRKKLEQERETNNELRDTVHSLSKKLDSRESALAAAKMDLSQKKLELQKLEQDKSTFILDMEQFQSSIESLKRQINQHEREFKSAQFTLEKKNSALLEAQQRVETAVRQAESSKTTIEELRSKLSFADSEIEKLNSSKNSLSSENLEFRTTLTEMKVQLTEKKSMLQRNEEALASLKKEKSMVQLELSYAKRESSSQKCLLSELEKEIELRADELDIERKNLQEVMEEFKKKTEELKSCKITMEDMEGALAAVQEEKNNLEIELADIRGECMAVKSLKKSIEQRLEACSKKSEEEEECYHITLNEIKSNLDHSQSELMALAKKYNALENDYRQIHGLRESSENELAVLREEHHLLKSNSTSITKAKKSLEEKSDSLQRQLDDSMELLVQKSSELKQVQNNLSLTRTQLDDMENELAQQRQDLSATNESYERVQVEGEHQAEKVRILTHEIQKLREELLLEKTRADANSDEATCLHSKCKELSDKLHQNEQEICELQIAREDAHANYVNTISSIKEQHEAQLGEMRVENSGLSSEVSQLNDQLFSKERQVTMMKEDLDSASNRFSNAESKCMKQRAEMAAKEDSHEILKSDHLQLESKNVEARAEITDLKGKLSSQITSNELLKSELGEVKRECSTLRDKLKMQRETAASSHNKIQQEHHKKSSQLRAKIQEMSERINEANKFSLEKEQDISKLQTDNEKLASSLVEENDRNVKAKYEIHEQMTSLKVLEQRVEQYQSCADIERGAKLELKQSLSDERVKRQNLELVVAEQEEKNNMIMRELCQVQKFYKKEEAKNEKLKIEIDQLKEEVLETKHHHDVLTEQQRRSKHHLEHEVASIRQKHHSDKKSLKEKIKVLQENLQRAMDQLVAKTNQLQSLEANGRSLSNQIEELHRRLANSDEKLLSKREECKKLRAKQHAYEIQVAQLQADIRGLENSQIQLEDVRKKAEAKSKSEIKRVLSEVSEQMEQQSSAQKYLEKLRTDNELVVIKDKERVIADLRSELKTTRQESKKDRMHLEQLKMESLYLKNQQLEQDKSRRRLEARLEQVNDTLSKTLPTRHLKSLMRQEGPLSSSTPSPSRSFSVYPH